MIHFSTNQMQIKFNSKEKIEIRFGKSLVNSGPDVLKIISKYTVLKCWGGCTVNRECIITPSRSNRNNACDVNWKPFFPPSLEKYDCHEFSGEILDGNFWTEISGNILA